MFVSSCRAVEDKFCPLKFMIKRHFFYSFLFKWFSERDWEAFSDWGLGQGKNRCLKSSFGYGEYGANGERLV